MYSDILTYFYTTNEACCFYKYTLASSLTGSTYKIDGISIDNEMNILIDTSHSQNYFFYIMPSTHKNLIGLPVTITILNQTMQFTPPVLFFEQPLQD